MLIPNAKFALISIILLLIFISSGCSITPEPTFSPSQKSSESTDNQWGLYCCIIEGFRQEPIAESAAHADAASEYRVVMDSSLALYDEIYLLQVFKDGTGRLQYRSSRNGATEANHQQDISEAQADVLLKAI